MTYPTSITPQTSQTAATNYIPNLNTYLDAQGNIKPNNAGTVTHPQWVNNLVEYWVSKWDHGDHTLPAGWDSSYGSPDPTDTTGNFSPRTVLAFTRYFQNYKPGLDPSIDSQTPYVPPGPNDYILDPVVQAAQITNDQWQKTYDKQIEQFGITADQTARRDAASAFNSAFQNELTKYATQAGIYNANTVAQMNAFNTQAGIYNANETNRRGALESAGTLAQGLQNTYDARTQNAINLQAHPNDFVEREYAVRALNGPQGTTQPGYKDVDALGQVIDRLIHYTPPAAPAAPLINGGAPNIAPTAPNQQNFQLPGPLAQALQPPPSQNPLGAKPFTPGPGQTSYVWPDGTYHPTPAPQANPNLNSTPQNPQYTSGGGSQIWDSAKQAWVDKSGNPIAASKPPTQGSITPPSNTVKFADGAMGTAARQMVIGDPQSDGGPNPEYVQIINPGPKTHTKVTPLKGKKSAMQLAMGTPMYADGTTVPPYNGSGPEEDPNGNPMEDPNSELAEPGNIDTTNLPAITNPDGSISTVRTISVNVDGNEVLIPTVIDGRVVSNSEAIQRYLRSGQHFGKYKSIGAADRAAERLHNQEALRVPRFANGTDAPNVGLKSYDDSAYQNLPELRYLQGGLSGDQYNTLATGNATGAFGIKAPEAGSFNYKRGLDIANDPVGAALAASLYSSANRDYASTMAAAKARAPFGQALATSLIRT